jgi:undecaprenyl-diphosphatase
MELLKASILGIVEGLTEFVPVSSTGHLIVAGQLLDFRGPQASTFEIFIQLGAIFAVIFLYKEIFSGLLSFEKSEGLKGVNGVALITLTTLPALFVGALAHGFIKSHLFNMVTVAVGLGAGGLFILSAEAFLPQVKKRGLDLITHRDALVVGLFQCLAMWPGMSRSACTIIGAMLIGIDRKSAAEYSFFAAVPVIFAASFLDLYKNFGILNASDIPIFLVGFGVSFLSAWVSIRLFVRIVSKYRLNAFGWYRIAVAPLIFYFSR